MSHFRRTGTRPPIDRRWNGVGARATKTGIGPNTRGNWYRRQVEQAGRQMEAHRIINESAAQARFNCSGGWIVDAYGNKTYKPGYFG